MGRADVKREKDEFPLLPHLDMGTGNFAKFWDC